MKIVTLVFFLLFTLTASAAGTRSESVRLDDGSLLRAGDSKSKLFRVWGFPDIQQYGIFWYHRDGKMYQFKFSGDNIAHISRGDD